MIGMRSAPGRRELNGSVYGMEDEQAASSIMNVERTPLLEKQSGGGDQISQPLYRRGTQSTHHISAAKAHGLRKMRQSKLSAWRPVQDFGFCSSRMASSWYQLL
jgi:hypothetical protein